uniref:OmpH family outer membrane protein n=2 Tax=Gelidibacter sp. TaxID=2018083 RepID=UPI00404919B9
MKHNVLFLLTLIGLLSFTSHAQRGVRIGYIDTEYILQNVPEYQEATAQLETKVQQWKSEIEKRLNDIDQKKKQLNSESVLLTKELYEERLEDITFEESEVLDYQQKRFGPNGDLMIQKKQLIEPIQDQIFSAVQEIAGNKQYDFIFDKSSDAVMLYSAERYDLSEQVLRTITRTSKRTQAETKAERRAAEEEDIVPEINETLEARQKALDEKKAAQAKAIEDRKAQQVARRDSLKAAADARRQKIIDDREKAKAERDGTTTAKDSTSVNREGNPETTETDVKKKTAAEIAEEKREKAKADREARQKEIEDRKKKIIADREKAKKEREEQNKKNDSVPKNED